MRTIDRPGSFKLDYKREAKGQYRSSLDSELLPVLKALVVDQPLAPRYRDHDLTGGLDRPPRMSPQAGFVADLSQAW